MSRLLVVESPAKCKKIQGFLGAGWRVQATMGHIRALKEDLSAIGFNAGKPTWIPTYEAIAAKSAAIANLRKSAKGAEVYLGADDDREGEAIAWHTCAILGLDPAKTPRVVFHEITEPALKAAVANPRRIDMNKFNAQQARTMLDMLIGFTLSPCLWRGVGFKAGLSAGRCQTPALRIIYDRDREIEAYVPSVTWKLKASTESLQWSATKDLEGEAAAVSLLQDLAISKSKDLTVIERNERISTHKPPIPFITSSLQQEAHSRLGIQPKIAMKAAQTLYEAGHITYMRTDNPVLSQEAADAASEFVKGRWGEEYLGSVEEGAKKVVKKVVKKTATKVATAKPTAPEAQAAHEAIRPTHMEVDSSDQLEGVGPTERRLYDLIWKRTIQSVMGPEQRDVVRVSATPASKETPVFQTEWDQTRFAGWRILEQNAETETAEATAYEARKSMIKGSQIPWTIMTAAETRSSPPARYTEASLIRELESRGIGRPSTYATLVETVLDRGYVEKSTIAATPVALRIVELKAGAKAPKQATKTEKSGGEKDKLHATALGRTVIEWLGNQFEDMIDYDFTATMESQLDEVAKGTRSWDSVLEETWRRYEDRYNAVMAGPRATTAPDGSPNRSANKAEFGDGYKMIVSKKGPLFVLEREGSPTRFASVPSGLSIQTATRADCEKAFAVATKAAEIDELGIIDGKPVIRKKGPYGYYVQWGTIRLNCKEEETLEEIQPRLEAKADPNTIDHTIGPFRIKKGPYGLYMFKATTGGKKPTFVSIPDATPWSTLTVEGAEALYKHASEAKKEATKKPRAKETV